MRRYAFIRWSLALTIVMVGAALTLKLVNAPPGPPGRDSLVLLSPVFFGMAAQKATRYGGAAVILSLVGLLFAAFGLAAALGG